MLEIVKIVPIFYIWWKRSSLRRQIALKTCSRLFSKRKNEFFFHLVYCFYRHWLIYLVSFFPYVRVSFLTCFFHLLKFYMLQSSLIILFVCRFKDVNIQFCLFVVSRLLIFSFLLRVVALVTVAYVRIDFIVALSDFLF